MKGWRTLVNPAAWSLLAAVLLAAPQDAGAVQYLSVNWDSSRSRTIHLLFDGAPMTVSISPGVGYIDNTFDHLHSAGGHSIPKMFCIDIFQLAFDSDQIAGNNREWDVRAYTGVDGTAGFTTGDSDQYRNQGSLYRAAFLANTFGRGIIGPDARVALNVAIWKAAYGSRLQYVSGLFGVPQTNAYATYMAAYATGGENYNYRWYDNAADDSDDTHQDFIEPVPEPGTMLLLGTGLMGSGLLFRRRRK